MWICGEVGVNRDLLNSFRSGYPEALDEIMAETIGILADQDLINLQRLSQDGMRVRASAGKSSFHRQKTLEDHLQEARLRIKQLREEDDDDDTGNSSGTAAQKRAAGERRQRVQQALEELAKLRKQKEKRKKGTGSQARCSTTDPEARNMKMADGGFRPAYNVQFATTCGSRFVVGVDVTNQGTDSGQMKPMVDAIEEVFATKPEEYLVDGGFSISRNDVTELEESGIEVYGPIKMEQEMLQEGKNPYERHRGDSEAFYRFRQRMSTEEAKAKYKERSSTAEFPNAGCRNRGLQQFPVRGKEKARTIAVWHAIVHNLQMILCYGWMDKLVRA
jgi:exonuclease VII small subunit